MMTEFNWVYVPCESKEKAQLMAKKLIEEKLIACANIVDSVTSIYNWEDQVQTNNEVLCLMKSKTSLFENLKKRIKDLHTYDVPCIASFPIEMINADYISWLQKNLRP